MNRTPAALGEPVAVTVRAVTPHEARRASHADGASRAFVEDVTHQIRTPLTALVTHAHLIEATVRQIPPHAEYAELMARIAESAAAIQESADRLARDVREMARSTKTG